MSTSLPSLSPNISRSRKKQAKREARYLKRLEKTKSWLPKWRKQSVRRKLVVTFYVNLVLLCLSGIALMASMVDALPGWFSFLWFIFTITLMFSWTALNITVDMIDSAPLGVLDEYEQEQILNLRGFAYRCYSYFSLVLLVGLTVIGAWTLNTKPDWSHYLPYGFGIFGIVFFLAITSIPTTFYAWNLRDD